MNILQIKNLSVMHDGKKILHDINMSVNAGDIMLLNGHNGSGKTTLVKTIAGQYEASGEIIFNNPITNHQSPITDLSTAERAKLGIFFGLQHVPEIPGLSITSFLKHSMMAHNEKMPAGEFFKKLTDARMRLNIPENWLGRAINVGFSGGERKKIMMLHLLLIKPKLAILDEPDSGVDTETQTLFAEVIKELNQPSRTPNPEPRTTFLIISHQEGFTKLIKPTAVTTLESGKIMV